PGLSSGLDIKSPKARQGDTLTRFEIGIQDLQGRFKPRRSNFVIRLHPQSQLVNKNFGFNSLCHNALNSRILHGWSLHSWDNGTRQHATGVRIKALPCMTTTSRPLWVKDILTWRVSKGME